MNESKPTRPPLFERLKASLEEAEQWMQDNTAAQVTVWENDAPKTQPMTRAEWEQQPSRLSYDPETDALRISLYDVITATSNEVEPGVILNYDSEGNIIGIAVLHASRRLKLPAREAA